MAEAVDGKSALALADEHRPDLLFLDVRLPELSGLEVARRIRHPAEIVFTTAYDRFAVAAFEIGAVDYLVKPFGRERLAAAVARVRARLGQTAVSASDRVRELPRARDRSRASSPATGTASFRSRVDGIRRIQAQGDYAEVHAAEGVFLLHVTLAELAARLDPARFRQVHRSHIVNLDAVRAPAALRRPPPRDHAAGRDRRRREPRRVRGAAPPGALSETPPARVRHAVGP